MIARWWPWVAVVLVGFVVACGGGGKKASALPTALPTQTAAGASGTTGGPAAAGDPNDVIKAWVQQTFQKDYAPDCAAANATNDTGKYCGTFKGDRGQVKAYQVGPAFSQPTHWVMVESKNNQWVLNSATAITPDTASIPGIPWPLATGVDLVVASGGDPPCVNVREGPALAQKAVDCIKNGAKVRLTAGPTKADNYDWWQVEGRTGWVVGMYLRYPDAAQ